MADDCLFCKIVAGSIPSKKVYEDELCYGFEDIAPKAPVHDVFVPKEHFSSSLEVTEAREKAVGHLVRVASDVAKIKGISPAGYRLVLNTNADAGQTVFHLHLHLLGGRKLLQMG
ncbi:MAG: histidine triad nucleotide-binding protein [candidate division FCPU426 bacterium]